MDIGKYSAVGKASDGVTEWWGVAGAAVPANKPKIQVRKDEFLYPDNSIWTDEDMTVVEPRPGGLNHSNFQKPNHSSNIVIPNSTFKGASGSAVPPAANNVVVQNRGRSLLKRKVEDDEELVFRNVAWPLKQEKELADKRLTKKTKTCAALSTAAPLKIPKAKRAANTNTNSTLNTESPGLQNDMLDPVSQSDEEFVNVMKTGLQLMTEQRKSFFKEWVLEGWQKAFEIDRPVTLASKPAEAVQPSSASAAPERVSPQAAAAAAEHVNEPAAVMTGQSQLQSRVPTVPHPTLADLKRKGVIVVLPAGKQVPLQYNALTRHFFLNSSEGPIRVHHVISESAFKDQSNQVMAS